MRLVSRVSSRVTAPVLAPLVACAALAGCSSSASEAGSATPAAASSAAGSAPPASAPSTTAGSSAPTPASSAPGSSGGEITVTGALSGRMTVDACHDGMAQLAVTVDGEEQTYNGLIDADDFTFAVPHSTGYTLADGTSKPSVSGTTYTVKNTKLVSITNDDTITANGSVTCP